MPGLTDAELAVLRRFLKGRCGLALSAEKRYLAEARLGPLWRSRGWAGPGELVMRLRFGRDEALGQAVVEAMVTGETSFFRDRAPFALLREAVLPRLIAARAGSRRLRIWCAACSTGQEPYSLAMLLDDMAASLAGWRIELRATDLSEEALGRARDGCFSQLEVQRGLPVRLLLRHFARDGDSWRISARLRGMIDFRPLNLIEDFAGLGRFDLILCRNVLIYLDAATKAALLRRLSAALVADGVLMLGSAETALAETSLAPDPDCAGLYRPVVARPEPPSPSVGTTPALS